MYKLGFFGLISGILSFFVIQSSFFQDVAPGLSLSVLPGIIFGIAIAIYFFLSKPALSPLQLFAWVVISAAAYYAAYFTATHLFVVNAWAALFAAGLFGSFLMLIGFHFFLQELDVNQLFALTFLGGILGLSFLGYRGGGTIPFFSLFVVWHTGMAFALGFVLEKGRG